MVDLDYIDCTSAIISPAMGDFDTSNMTYMTTPPMGYAGSHHSAAMPQAHTNMDMYDHISNYDMSHYAGFVYR